MEEIAREVEDCFLSFLDTFFPVLALLFEIELDDEISAVLRGEEDAAVCCWVGG